MRNIKEVKATLESQTDSVVSSISSSLSCFSEASCHASGRNDSAVSTATEVSDSARADEQARSTGSQEGRARQLAISVDCSSCGDHEPGEANHEANSESPCRPKHEQLRMHERLNAIEHMPAL